LRFIVIAVSKSTTKLKEGVKLPNMLITFLKLSVLVVIYILLGLLLHTPVAKLKKDVFALGGVILIAVLVHVVYHITSVMTTLGDMEFYVAFIGGGLALLIYNTVSNWKKSKI
jgi:hypothetical protein